jgi:hypothetical protein
MTGEMKDMRKQWHFDVNINVRMSLELDPLLVLMDILKDGNAVGSVKCSSLARDGVASSAGVAVADYAAGQFKEKRNPPVRYSWESDNQN